MWTNEARHKPLTFFGKLSAKIALGSTLPALFFGSVVATAYHFRPRPEPIYPEVNVPPPGYRPVEHHEDLMNGIYVYICVCVMYIYIDI